MSQIIHLTAMGDRYNKYLHHFIVYGLTLPCLKARGFLRPHGQNILFTQVPRLTTFALVVRSDISSRVFRA
ncbi:hypothetical protein LC605_03055 [Nostoc sp. CHAB 5836]|uniref:hypothetical protein n=1 Tax=Nostoc sp. CHAB 5836 TaxID=2780404 RepID=UPI001E54F8AA|nr:hypothetical protein [Nostoc sp. CHAB 5836]MCC5614070.1 hypothetical protein [Nostoc sp. CHAB 5836]